MSEADTNSGVVLVVEDHPLVRMTTVEMVEEAGLTVVAADNADDALHILRHRDDICAMFTDVDMPGTMNGLELAQLVRRLWPGIQTVITSGGPLPHDCAVPEGAAFYEKPYRHQVVIAELKRSFCPPAPRPH